MSQGRGVPASAVRSAALLLCSRALFLVGAAFNLTLALWWTFSRGTFATDGLGLAPSGLEALHAALADAGFENLPVLPHPPALAVDCYICCIVAHRGFRFALHTLSGLRTLSRNDVIYYAITKFVCAGLIWAVNRHKEQPGYCWAAIAVADACQGVLFIVAERATGARARATKTD
jgi:hypothetical protein